MTRWIRYLILSHIVASYVAFASYWVTLYFRNRLAIFPWERFLFAPFFLPRGLATSLINLAYWQAFAAELCVAWSSYFVCLVGGVIGLNLLGAHTRKQDRLSAGLCPTCGYDLRASRERCPECGTTIQPPLA